VHLTFFFCSDDGNSVTFLVDQKENK